MKIEDIARVLNNFAIQEKSSDLSRIIVQDDFIEIAREIVCLINPTDMCPKCENRCCLVDNGEDSIRCSMCGYIYNY
jgi:hypothetical protein